jgi:hypothetical protein
VGSKRKSLDDVYQRKRPTYRITQRAHTHRHIRSSSKIRNRTSTCTHRSQAYARRGKNNRINSRRTKSNERTQGHSINEDMEDQ